MKSEKQAFTSHLGEIKRRLRFIIFFYIFFFVLLYFYKEKLYIFTLSPLSSDFFSNVENIIYTGLAEAFFSYLKLSGFFAFLLIIPIINWHIYCFISPALFTREKKIAIIILILSPFLFLMGFFFVFFFVMPKVWYFFLSFENLQYNIPLVLQAKIGEYVNLVIQFIFAFGMVFQLPIIIIILSILNFVNSLSLIKFRKLAVVSSFVIGAFLTPPDILSQFCLALPMIFLYEISIKIIKYLENKKMDIKC